MKLLILSLLFSFYTHAQIKKRICDAVVKTATKAALVNFTAINSIVKYLNPDKDDSYCERPLTAKEMLINSIQEGDKDKFNEALKKLEDNHILQLLAKVAPDRGQKEGETQLEAFKRFLNEKFYILNKRLSQNEKDMLKQSPLKTLLVLFQYEKALNYIKQKKPELQKVITIPNGKGDAIRHMFINALASRFGMDYYVKNYSTNRELSGGYIEYDEAKWSNFNRDDFKSFNGYEFKKLLSCNPDVPELYIEEVEHEKMLDRLMVNRMDIHNNAIGISIGKDHPCDSVEEIFNRVQQKYETGKAREVTSAGGRCFDVTSNYDRDLLVNEKRNCLQSYSQTNKNYKKIRYPRKTNDGIYKCP
jgi:hypothetical protein